MKGALKAYMAFSNDTTTEAPKQKPTFHRTGCHRGMSWMARNADAAMSVIEKPRLWLQRTFFDNSSNYLSQRGSAELVPSWAHQDVMTQEAEDNGSPKHRADSEAPLLCHQRRRGQLIPSRRSIGQPRNRKPHAETLHSVNQLAQEGTWLCEVLGCGWGWGTGPHHCLAGLLPSWHTCIHHWRAVGFPKLLSQMGNTLHCTISPCFHSLWVPLPTERGRAHNSVLPPQPAGRNWGSPSGPGLPTAARLPHGQNQDSSAGGGQQEGPPRAPHAPVLRAPRPAPLSVLPRPVPLAPPHPCLFIHELYTWWPYPTIGPRSGQL